MNPPTAYRSTLPRLKIGRWSTAAIKLRFRKLNLILSSRGRLLIEEQPPILELPPQQAQGHLQLVFRRFLSVFPWAEHSLALFLDDWQWLDAATLDKAVEMKVNFCAAHLKRMGLGNVDWGSRSRISLRTRPPTIGEGVMPSAYPGYVEFNNYTYVGGTRVTGC
jgi:hypothetical protein